MTPICSKVQFHAMASIVTITFLDMVNAKNCYYTDYSDGDRMTKYYHCSAYEHCCSRGCCDNFMSFYRLWYFWFCMLMILMFCSGGSYWYKRRYLRQRIMSEQPCSVNNTTILSVGTSSHHPTNTAMAGAAWNPYANVPRPAYKHGPSPTVHIAPGSGIVSAYMPPPPAYSTAISTPANQQEQAPPPSYASTMVLDAIQPGNDSNLQQQQRSTTTTHGAGI